MKFIANRLNIMKVEEGNFHDVEPESCSLHLFLPTLHLRGPDEKVITDRLNRLKIGHFKKYDRRV